MDRAVAIQSSPYGYDNSAVLDAVTGAGGSMKFVGVFRPDVDGSELRPLVEQGLVGARFNLAASDRQALSGSGVERTLGLFRELDLFVEVLAPPDAWRELAPKLQASGVRVVVDHFGAYVDAQTPPRLPDAEHIARLAGMDRAFVKLTWANRLSARQPCYDDLDETVRSLEARFGLERMLWGSGWPFINCPRKPTYAELLDNLARWFPDGDKQRRLVWETPARLFGFSSSGVD
ncbi:MAG: amidohydrolase family protein [Geminicoccaceae bacterium]